MKTALRNLASRISRRAAMGMVAVVAAFGMTAAVVAIDATPAAASATHCAWVAPFHIGGRTIPLGSYCFSVNGSGLHVNFTLSSYESAWTENLSERVDAVDVYGNTYGSWWTWTGYGTLYGTHAWYGVAGNFRPGSLCGNLFSNGIMIARVCNGIHT